MSEKCPRSKCDWQSGYDRKCRWPTYNCPWKAEREQAAIQKREADMPAAKARAKKQSKLESMPGVVKQLSGRWVAHITTGKNGKERYHLGTFDTIDEAAAIRKEAEQHRAQGDLKEWMQQLKLSKRRGRERQNAKTKGHKTG